jgi:hypothetical protein
MNFALKYFGGAGSLAQTTTRAAIIYGWTRIKRDRVLRADIDTSPTVAMTKPHPFAKT